MVSLEQLRDRPPTSRGRWELPLGDTDRGSIRVGELTVLFQLVQAPPVSQAQLARPDFRPRLLNDDDPVFMGFLGLFTVMAAGFAAYTSTVQTPALIGDIVEVERFASVILPAPEPKEPDPVVPDALADNGQTHKVKDTPNPEPDPKPTEAVAKNDTPPDRPLTADEMRYREAQQKAALRDQVYEESAVLQFLATRGDSANGWLSPDDAWGADGEISLGGDQDLDEHVELVSNWKQGSGSGTSREDVGIDLEDLTAGETTITGSGNTGPTATIREPTEGIPTGSPDAARVAASVRRYYPQVKTCYERALKENPTLSGRIEVDWVVDRGRATEIFVVDNTTRDSELEACITHSMQYWQFDGDIEEFALSYPFVLAPG
jgi:hypothetical protein